MRGTQSIHGCLPLLNNLLCHVDALQLIKPEIPVCFEKENTMFSTQKALIKGIDVRVAVTVVLTQWQCSNVTVVLTQWQYSNVTVVLTQWQYSGVNTVAMQ